MYQGKFAKNRAKETPEIKKATPAPETVKTPEVEPEVEFIVRQEPKAEAPKPAEKKEAPKKKAEKKGKKKEKVKKKKANKVISTIFYTLYFLMIIGFFGGMYFLTNWLEGWLVDFQSTQPTTRSEEVFQEYFADPDWAEIYDLAGIQSTAFEDKDDFVTYMEDKYAGVQLTYMETSAGLSKDHKYNLKNGEQTIGYFTLTDRNATDSESTAQTPEALAEELTSLSDWQLGQVNVSFTRNESVSIQKIDGHTAYVNGVAVGDDYTQMIASTVAENYLPEGTTGFRLIHQTVSGLLLEPEVTILDADGNPSTVTYDEESGIYIEQTEATTITQEEEETVTKAAEAFGLFMIEKAGANNLSKYWKSTTKIYKTITTMDRWFSGCKSYEFVNESVNDYVRYTDTLYSARMVYTLNATRSNGTIKEFPLDCTLFFEKQKSGKWLVIDMVNVDVQEQIAEVRITFLDANGEVVSTSFNPDDSTTLFAPVLTVPAGQQFAGWFQETVDASGTKTLQLVFTPDESGQITIPAGTTLTPMVLHPVFEAVGTAAPAATEAAETTPTESEAV